jgi:hypothetical protein
MGITARQKAVNLEEKARYVKGRDINVDIDICEFLMVDKKNPKIYYCKLAKKEIDVAFNPCVLPAVDRISLCPFYRNHWFNTSMKKP